MTAYPDWLTDRCFGGSLVADTPGNDVSPGGWPEGECAPGARECCDYLLEVCNSSDSAELPVFVFLVGGAGNGKSYLAKNVTNQIRGTRIDERSVFASRAYLYKLENGGSLRVVNDATIPPKETSQRSAFLIDDISNALEMGSSVLACVNRGILVAEANIGSEASIPTIGIAADLVQWLLSGALAGGSGTSGGWRLVTESPQIDRAGSHYSYCRIENEGNKLAEVHVAFMDQCSLFEPFPASGEGGNKEFGPILSQQLPRPQPILSASRSDANLPGKEVLLQLYRQVAAEIGHTGGPGGDLDPVQSNLQFLCDPELLHGLCNILRAAEIISGNHFTYRDIWGLAVIALVGPVPAGELPGYERWVGDQSVRARGQDVADQLRALVSLGMCRVHMTLFSGYGPSFLLEGSEQLTYPTVQALDSMKCADPLVCLSEDVLRTAKEKLTLLDDEKGPGRALAEQNELFAKCWTALDQRLEDTILKWLYSTEEGPKFSERNQLLAWYGQYLARLLALVSGKPAHTDLVNSWQEAWLRTSMGSPTPTSRIADGLNRLLFKPFDDRKHETFLPVFSSKVSPLTSGGESQRVALKIPSREYHWENCILGNSIMMILKNYKLGPTPICEFMLDFSMLRETNAQYAGDGFTEAAIDVEPRLERVRAGILAAEMRQGRRSGVRPDVVFVDGSNPILAE